MQWNLQWAAVASFLESQIWSHAPSMVCYRPLTKLQEGNVFRRVCLSVCQTCSLGPHHTGTPSPSPNSLKHVHCVVHTSVSKWAVGIQLKYLLVHTAGERDLDR